MNLTFNNTATDRTDTRQTWTVPVTSTYTTETWGAQGGASVASHRYGARMRGDFVLPSGTVLKILVGQAGTYNSGYASGGGTFITTSANGPLVIASASGGGSVGYCGNATSNGGGSTVARNN